ncbi:MoxR family ATPase [Nitriliruptoraceae bacterium ZYF776]|nr:MoxR family ATPase [Profundirhabdus halotolerans]
MLTDQQLAQAAARCDQLGRTVASVIHGKDDVIRLLLVALLAEGHVLLEDRPGVGKTTLARTVAQALQLRMGRVQFTPDLLPSDITGNAIYDQRSGDFRFRSGPIFNHIVLADEINRASPKTQSALLEVMEERQVTADGTTYPIPRPFLVLATQNPLDMEGTYALPEAQLDRFLMKLPIGYPSNDAEIRMLQTQLGGTTTPSVSPVLSEADLAELLGQVHAVEVSGAMESYLVAITDHTRTLPEVRLGVSPRGTLALARAARALALSLGQGFVTPDHIRVLAPWVLSHRVVLASEAELAGRTANDVIDDVLGAVPVPRAAA